MNDVIVRPGTAHGAITNLALAKISDSFYKIALGSQKDINILVVYFLYLRSIEVGLKAAILSVDITKESKVKLMNRSKRNEQGVGHDLLKIYSLFTDLYEEKIFSKTELIELKKIMNYIKIRLLSISPQRCSHFL